MRSVVRHLTTLKAISEVLNIVDEDELLLSAGFYEIPQDHVAIRVHSHVPECVGCKTNLDRRRTQVE